jgi:hypothetical protein
MPWWCCGCHGGGGGIVGPVVVLRPVVMMGGVAGWTETDATFANDRRPIDTVVVVLFSCCAGEVLWAFLVHLGNGSIV